MVGCNIYDWTIIAYYIIDIFGCLPWNVISKAFSREWIKLFSFIRIFRACKLLIFLKKIERMHENLSICIKILKVIFLVIFSAHFGGCMYYHLATMLPESERGATWFNKVGNATFENSGIWTRYTTSVYLSFVSLTTIDFGDIHPVNNTEKIFSILFGIYGLFLMGYISHTISELLKKRCQFRQLVNYFNRDEPLEQPPQP